MQPDTVIFGLGLIGIGREWGHANAVVPPEARALSFLEHAYALGVRFFDTAPSYGSSEERFGKFLHRLNPSERSGVTIASKFGEHWNEAAHEPYVDHSYDALRRSIDQSVERLGRIDVLQLHRTRPEVLESDDFRRACEYARSLGIASVGASVSDALSADLTVADPNMTVMQCPYNLGKTEFGDAIAAAVESGMLVLTNRPFGMGALLYGDAPLTHNAAYNFVRERLKRGVILTGTKNAEHLAEDLRSFAASVGCG